MCLEVIEAVVRSAPASDVWLRHLSVCRISEDRVIEPQTVYQAKSVAWMLPCRLIRTFASS